MSVHPRRAIAIVGVGAVLPDAPDVPSFWNNLVTGRYSISETPRERWDPALYYHPDPKAPLKTYSKIGGWVRDYPWDPIAWKLPIPPRVAAAMDRTQQWGVVAAREALLDYGYPERPLDRERTAVVMGNAMGGDRHYVTALHILLPEIAAELAATPSFRALPAPAQEAIARELTQGVAGRLPEITEDTMPGELSNIIAGRIANLFDLHGPNFVCDAACASAMAAVGAAIEGLDEGTYDAVITGGIDANMSASTFVKFCKIGALSATGTRPYAEGADGFVMGEGAAVFLLKRLADAERDGDRVYAVLRGMGGASDGRGKGITAPNPKGQRLAVERAWQAAGLSPATVGYVEGHGTSTAVGDVVEVESLAAVFGAAAGTPGSIPLGSVKSNIGHLKGAAGAAGLLKAALALHHQMLPPSLHCERPNPAIDFARGPFRVNTALRSFESRSDTPRRACVSAFGFGGTNFHAVLEEWIPGRLTSEEKTRVAVGAPARTSSLTATAVAPAGAAAKAPLRGALLLGAADERALVERLRAARDAAAAGELPAPEPPSAADLAAPLRLAIDHGSAAELVKRCDKAIQAIEGGRTGAWRVLRAQGVVRWEGPPSKVAFLYTGQGSQYVNMLADLRRSEPIVAATFAEADEVMTPLFGRPLTDIVFAPESDAARFAASEEALKQTQYTQPAVLTVDVALTRLLAAYGITPDFVMGHSLGEYGALVAAGSLSFPEALEAVSARGQEMARLSVGDPGRMAAVFAPLEEIESVLAGIEGYVVVANINSIAQAVIGGETAAVERAVAAFGERGREARYLPVSHAFHTRIVAPASEPLRRMLARLKLSPPRVPLVSNASGRFYPMAPDAVPEMIELLGRQIAEPVQFVQGLSTIYEAGARVFVELGPKRALQGFVEDVLGDRPDVLSLATNHPKLGDAGSFNLALCGLYAAGRGAARPEAVAPIAVAVAPPDVSSPASSPVPAADARPHATASAALDLSGGDSRMSTLPPVPSDRFADLGRLFVDFLSKGLALASGESSPATAAPIAAPALGASAVKDETVVVTGAALGLPGAERVFDDGNLARLLAGEQMLGAVPAALRRSMVEKRITRLVKSEEGGRFETIESPDEVIKVAARAGELEFGRDFGFPADRTAAFDRTTMLAIGAGIDALRDAGIPLVMRYKTTTTGTLLPDRWGLPEELRDGTGVIFGSAFPGYDQLMGKMDAFHRERSRRERLEELRALRGDLAAGDASAVELDRRIAALEAELVAEPFTFDRRFLFQVLSMGHSQFAEAIGARGPNTAINSACATTTQAFSLASDWIRAGRCDRVIVIAADDITSDNLFGWFASGFLASGAAATDERVEDAALPFDRRRHGLLIGMGAAAAVLERAGAARERGLAPICEVLSTVTANSAFHGSRLDVSHIGQMMEKLVADAESRWGIDRHAVAPEMVFVSHETYTPARGGSAQAEIDALRRVFGSSADRIVIANTKGYTGHPMAVGIEDVMAIKSLETGIVPPVPNIREIDPDLGALNISRGGSYPVRYALRLGAGFGSQISMTLLRWSPTSDGRHRTPAELGFAYRVADRAAWESFLSRASGDPQPAIEIDHRTLRIVDRGLARLAPAPAPTAAVSRERPSQDHQAVERQAATAAAVPPGSQASVATPVAVTAPAAASASSDAVTEQVLELIADKTGYPKEMLALDLDLEADLGIDTVKQAEVFAAIRERYGIERDPNLKLRDFPTIAKTIGFVYDKRPELRPTAPATAPTQILRSAQDEKVDASAKAGAVAPAAAVAFGSPTQTSLVSSSSTTAPTAVEDEVTATVLALVAEKTGYPREMLALDLDLEADLGVDTVKQAELFAAVREKYGIARDPNLKLRDFPTLAKTIGFVFDHRPDLRPGASPATPPEPTVAAPPAGAPASEAAPALDAGTFCRRIPVAVLRPALSLCKATGVELGHGRRVLVAGDRGGVAAPLIAQLTALGVAVSEIDADAALDELAARVTAIAAEGVDGLYWLPALDVEPAIAELDLDGFHRATQRRVKAFAAVLRALYEPLGRAGAFVVSATRLGGRHGVGGASAPLGGAVSGMTKTWARERPAGLVKVVDFESAADASAIAEALLDETLRDPGAIEIGHAGGERFTVTVEVSPLLAEADGNRDADDGVSLGPDSVAVVTGAAGSIVAAIVRDLARHGGSFHLLDLAPEPDPADADLARFASDRDGLKLELFARLSAAGERATPARIEKELARLERQRAALDAIDAIRAAGGRATYHCLDLRDAAAVATAVEAALAERGRIDLLLHAGGLEVSRLLPDKSDEELARVFDVKADGAFNLIRALRGAPLGALVTFGSIAGRFGNGGQADYAAANDFLAKLVASLATTQPGTLGLAFDWTGWAEIGMASRGSIPKLLEAAGIDLLPPSLGIPAVRRELAAGGPSREIVVAGRLGAMLDERETEGGLDPQAVDAGAPQGPMHGHARRLTLREGLVVELTLDPREQPFLDDHRIDGTPVLPGVMGIEAFAETARQLFPERRVAAVERLEFLAPFKFYRDEPRTLEVRGQFRQEHDEIVADCLLVGRRALPGQATSQETEHFRGRVRLAAPGANPPVRRLDLPDLADASELASEAIYRVYFHGPAYQVVARARRVGEAVVAELSPALPPNHRPAELATEMEPRWIELAFQTAGLDQLGRLGTLGLPRALGRVALLAHPEPGESIFALSQREPDGTSSIALVAGSGRILLEVEGYATIDLPGAGDPETLAPIRQALGAEPALEARS